ncbi:MULTISPECIES: hypothetical protein [Paenibacillus]|uniref:hypothetical protein n=1 Tax=Paenibacillus TaxID=44249 RepID=UPI0022B8ADDB|nr:hypothetical protein [Paenibacillus caseinilyticus]MCZ8521753.1 hypothetical protein [Paenibacillus caseinilyticus]
MHPLRSLIRPFLFVLCLFPAAALHAEPASPHRTPASIVVPKETAATADELAAKADLIVYGSLAEEAKPYPTGRKVDGRLLINYVQKFKVKRILRGTVDANGTLAILTDGFDPLPLPQDPLNLTYTGPLVQGEYVCFLHRVPQSAEYTITGGWQGLYPLQGGKLVALQKQGGFAAYGGMTVEQLQDRLRRP